jgi:hypothetical protein
MNFGLGTHAAQLKLAALCLAGYAHGFKTACELS